MSKENVNKTDPKLAAPLASISVQQHNGFMQMTQSGSSNRGNEIPMPTNNVNCRNGNAIDSSVCINQKLAFQLEAIHERTKCKDY